MDKEDMLLKGYSILARNPQKNSDALKATITQLCEINPRVAIRCWHDLIQDNFEEILSGISEGEFEYDSLGYNLIQYFDTNLIDEDFFRNAVRDFASDIQLLEMAFTLSPISDYTNIHYPIGYLIRHRDLQRADNILSAIYKNRMFSSYSKLWKEIIDTFYYSDPDHYSGGGIVSDENYKQPAEVQEFCVSWAERIPGEEEQAGALSHIMRIF